MPPIGNTVSVFSYASKQVNDSPNAHSSLIDAYLLTQTPYVTVILKGNILRIRFTN